MTKARTRCKGCREYFQFNIAKDKVTCPLCGYVNETIASVGFFKKDDFDYFRRT